MKAKVTWQGRMSFKGSADSGFELPLGTSPEVGGDDDGFRPMELFAIGLAGCTGMDVISILKKMRQDVTSFEVKVHSESVESHPKVFKSIILEYIFSGKNLDRSAVERAVELSSTRYCPGQAMLAKSVEIESRITILDEKL